VPRTLPQRALARRALVDVPAADKRKWVQHGVAVVGISVLGLTVAGSVAVNGNAQNTATPELVAAAPPVESVSTVVVPGVAVPSAFDRRSESVSRSSFRPALTAAAVSSGVDQRTQDLQTARRTVQQAAQRAAIEKRADSLEDAAKAIKKKATQLKKIRAAKAKAEAKAKAKREKAEERAAAKKKADKESGGSGHASLPITSGYRIAARFGDTGVWARYHTGIDFSAGMGTPIHAAAAGVVTNAGSGSAGWAGNYVTIRHSDGKTSLYAHMSSVTVHVGEKVSGGQRVGAVGMTGRTFGPHVHFEIYPPGVKVGDPYKAIDPAPWLHARGLHY
jgi:murein DD-endopeptidase MepM/ murein hydrolase activator NlpD